MNISNKPPVFPTTALWNALGWESDWPKLTSQLSWLREDLNSWTPAYYPSVLNTRPKYQNQISTSDPAYNYVRKEMTARLSRLREHQ